MSISDDRGVELTTWYLEQTDPSRIRPARQPEVPVEIRRAEVPSVELNRYLYTAVGGGWHWTDRLGWDWQQWQDWVTAPGVETWMVSVRGTPAGYAELDGRTPGEVEIAYFGLLPQFAGQRIGGHLLTTTLTEAWRLPDRWPDRPPVGRVWVHTCSWDGPAALANYQARGMELYRTDVTSVDEPAATPGPWPGANRP
ncbi:N-acetyltransferase [Actinoplanes sp. NBRC 101535]|nr:N-acetyltransferase [Actinoplanes sp. NBRC 101535]